MFIDTKNIQRALQKAGANPGVVDGDYGEKTEAAARRQLVALKGQSTYRRAWPAARVRIAIEQFIMLSSGIPVGLIDGIAGPQTQVAAEKWQDRVAFGEIVTDVAEHDTRPPPTIWPFQRDIEKFYGRVGENQVRLTSPYRLFLDWDLDTQIKSFLCHEKIHDATLRVMERVLDAYGPERIHNLGLDQFGGCLNVRRMRNGRAMSTHAWGIAIDWDADRNALRTPFAKSQMGKPEYARFLDLWEEEGFVSLGRARNYDAMHVQAARL